MELDDFIIGKTYVITKTCWKTIGGEIIGGEVITREILEPASKENSMAVSTDSEGSDIEQPTDRDIKVWREFLRVRNPKDNHIHLLHPSVIESASILN